jgi:hypothetical protein
VDIEFITECVKHLTCVGTCSTVVLVDLNNTVTFSLIINEVCVELVCVHFGHFAGDVRSLLRHVFVLDLFVKELLNPFGHLLGQFLVR